MFCRSSVDLRNVQRTVPSGDIRASLKTTGKLLLASVGPGFPGWLPEVLVSNLDLIVACMQAGMVPRNPKEDTSLGRTEGCDSGVVCPGVSYPEGIGNCRHLLSCLCGSWLFFSIGFSVGSYLGVLLLGKSSNNCAQQVCVSLSPHKSSWPAVMGNHGEWTDIRNIWGSHGTKNREDTFFTATKITL